MTKKILLRLLQKFQLYSILDYIYYKKEIFANTFIKNVFCKMFRIKLLSSLKSSYILMFYNRIDSNIFSK